MIRRYPDVRFDFLQHNDYEPGGSPSEGGGKSGSTRHSYDHQRSRRAGGNAPLSSVIAVLNDQIKTPNGVVERRINHVSRVVETYTGVHIPANKPVVGENVFTQCAGIHADGDNKDNLYYNDLLPERFGRVREYALGKMSGKANIRKNL